MSNMSYNELAASLVIKQIRRVYDNYTDDLNSMSEEEALRVKRQLALWHNKIVYDAALEETIDFLPTLNLTKEIYGTA